MMTPFSRLRLCFPVSLLLLTAYLALAEPAMAQSATAETAIPYAPVKRPYGTAIRRETLSFTAPMSYPRRGVMLIFSNGLSQGASWITVDVDARRIERAHTTMQTMPDGESEVILDSKEGGALFLAEVNTVVTLANEIWNPPPRSPGLRHFVTDARCDILLFDGDAVVRTIGSGDSSDPLVKAILILKAAAPAKP